MVDVGSAILGEGNRIKALTVSSHDGNDIEGRTRNDIRVWQIDSHRR